MWALLYAYLQAIFDYIAHRKAPSLDVGLLTELKYYLCESFCQPALIIFIREISTTEQEGVTDRMRRKPIGACDFVLFFRYKGEWESAQKTLPILRLLRLK